MFKFKVAQQQKIEHAVKNKVYLHKDDFNQIFARMSHKDKRRAYVKLNSLVYLMDVAGYAEQGTVCLSKMQRENLMLSTTMDYVKVEPFHKPSINYELSVIKIELKPFRLEYPREVKEKDLAKKFREYYQNHFFSKAQTLYFDFQAVQIIGRIIAADLKQTGMSNDKRVLGMFTEDTDLEFTCTDIKMLKIKADSKKVRLSKKKSMYSLFNDSCFVQI
jgi:hypothetical protein